MTLLNVHHSVNRDTQENIPAVDLVPLVRSMLLQEAIRSLTEREDLFEIERRRGEYRETVHKLKIHVFSEAELRHYRSSVIEEFLANSYMFSAMRSQEDQ